MGNPMTDRIAAIIEQMLEENGGSLELQRNKLAGRVGCVPSQINYVITSRFNTERGYQVESRRGGGGFVKIVKVRFNSADAFLMHTLAAVGDNIDAASARAVLLSLFHEGFITEREARFMVAATNERALEVCDPEARSVLRADILKAFLLDLRAYREAGQR